MKRVRHAVLVRLVDGPTGAAQEAAIRSLASKGSSLSSVLRAILLREAGREDLDVAVVDRMPRPCSDPSPSIMRPERCQCGALIAAH